MTNIFLFNLGIFQSALILANMVNPKISKIRLDELLIERQLADSPREADALMSAGQIVANDQRVDWPWTLVPATAVIRLKKTAGKYVSRAGDKLAGALEDFGLQHLLAGKVVLDVGAAAGGFTDCCLQL